MSAEANDVFIPGQLLRDGDHLPLGTKRAAARDPRLVTRTRRDFGYKPGTPAVAVLDLDVKGWPKELQERLPDLDAIIAAISEVYPGFRCAGWVARASASAGIKNEATGSETGISGWHIWFFVRDGADVRRFVDVLHKGLVCRTYGFCFVAKDGSPQIRTIIDRVASGAGERLVFEADAVLNHAHLVHGDGGRPLRVNHGLAIDTSQLQDLTPDEENSVRVMSELWTECAMPEINQRRLASGRTQFTAESGSKRVAVLLGDFDSVLIDGDTEIRLDDGRRIQALDVVLEPAAYNGATCADVLEPEYGGGRNKAIIRAGEAGVSIYSHAHGGRLYRIQLSDEQIRRGLERASHAH
ncbi:hypothetical protein [Prosthecomicrobium sp. N25]|uniref:hypothetical protein n=1 Tax=Prosthecomicrobium sp. N25 TaxID=3129254 RepID=UPI003076B97C